MNFKTSGASRRENANACRLSPPHQLRVIARSACDEAIQNPFRGSWIASLALAMTMMGMRASQQIAIPCFGAENLKSN
jgi:hypothetical protein